jgi:hypothetical protein
MTKTIKEKKENTKKRKKKIGIAQVWLFLLLT